MTLLAATVAPAAAADPLPPECAQSEDTVTCTYTEGSNAFTVPDGVSEIHVVAVGGDGAPAIREGTVVSQGGAGARVTGDLEVTPGTTMYAVVGGDADRGTGGANGGGDAISTGVNNSGAGGGASDVRSSASAVSSRLLVAAGGGGGGFGWQDDTPGGTGGDAGADGQSGGNFGGAGLVGGGGGGAGTATQGGEGGTGGFPNGQPGQSGNPGTGGDDTERGAGAGGGGLYGGGSGGQAGHEDIFGTFFSGGAGGGGGGSSLVPSGGTLTLAGHADSPRIEISYTVESPTAPAASLSPTSHSFGSQAIGISSDPQTFTLSNTGDAALEVDDVSVSGSNAGDFATSADSCSGASVEPGANCTVDVTFTPTASGTRSATLSFSHNADGSPHQAALTGTGQANADVSVNMSASPNPVKTNRQLTYTIVVSNAGPATAPGVRMTNVLPNATQFDSISPGPGWSCNTPPVGTTGTVTCDAVAMAPGTSSTITLKAKVVSSGKTSITNTAEVSSQAGDPNTTNNTSSATTSVRGPR